MSEFSFARVGRPSCRANVSAGPVGMSFKVDPRLKNLLLDISEGSDISLTDLLLAFALKEAGLDSLDDYGG